MDRQLKLYYVTPYDALDVHQWSGTIYYIAQSLIRQHIDVEYVKGLPFDLNFVSRGWRKYYNKFSSKGFMEDREPCIAKGYAVEALQQMNPDTDVIFSPGSIPIAAMKTDKMKVFYTDATFASMLDYSPIFTNLGWRTIRQGHRMEKKALDNCDLAIYASEWAAQSAIKHYGINPDKVKVVPFGANIECFRIKEDIEQTVLSRGLDVCRLLFIGTDWERKGGAVVMKIARRLHEKGVPVHLDIVGCQPDISEFPPYVTNHGFISKSTEDGRNKINELMSGSHFFVLPTLNECFGIVFAEASSFGVPCLGTKTGGVTSAIRDNLNGRTFDIFAEPEEYSDYIEYYFYHTEEYKKLAMSSFHEYETRLNWDVAGKTVVNLIKEKL